MQHCLGDRVAQRLRWHGCAPAGGHAQVDRRAPGQLHQDHRVIAVMAGHQSRRDGGGWHRAGSRHPLVDGGG